MSRARTPRPVSVASFAQSQNVRRDDERNEVEMLMPVMAEVFGNIGITKDDVDFICSGSTDYLIGGPFSFVMALDAVGVWPPRSESHVEMDGAWALYEAWVLLQEGEIDAALVYSFGRSSLGNLAEILALQLDPYYLAPLWPDPVSLAALQARALIDAGKGTEAEFASIASRGRRDALGNSKAQVANDIPADTLLAEEYVVSPLRRHTLPPITDGAAAIVLAAGEKAEQWGGSRCGSPASTTGWRPTRSEPGISPRRRPRPKLPMWPVWPTGRSTSLKFTPPSPTRRSSCGTLWASTTPWSSTRRAVLWPPTRSCRPDSSASARPPSGSGPGKPRRAVAHATSGPCLQQNLVCVLEGA